MRTVSQSAPPFLDLLRHRTGDGVMVRNARSGSLLATSVQTAFHFRTRLQGLLGKRDLDVGNVLVLAPCCAVHTFFMKFSIDVVFVSTNGTVIRVVSEMKPRRFALGPGAAAAIELRAGTINLSATGVGDRLLCFESSPGGPISISDGVHLS